MPISYHHSIVRHVVIGLSLLVTGISSSLAATFTVTTLQGDALPVSACSIMSCTLRQAIDAAEDETSNPGADTIVFANGLTGPLLLNVNDTPNDPSRDAGRSAFYIASDIIINGDNLNAGGTEGLGMISLNGQQQRRIFTVEATGKLTVNALTLSNGRSQGGSGGAGLGGAVFNFGEFTLTNSTVLDNSAVGGSFDDVFGSGSGGSGGSGGSPSGDGIGSPGGGGGGLGGGRGGSGGITGGGGNGGFGGFGGGGGGGGGSSQPIGGAGGGRGGNGGNGGFGGNGGAGGGSSDNGLNANGGNGGNGGFGGGGGVGGSDGSGTLRNAVPGSGGFGGGNGGGNGDFGTGSGNATGGGLGAGGAIFQFSGSLTLRNTSFSANQVSGGRGAVEPFSGFRISDDGQALGSALFVLGGSASISHSTFANNNAETIYVFAGENDMDLDNSGAVDIIDDQSLTISASLLNDTVACAGLAPIDAGGNLASNGCGPIIASPIIGLASALANNGGPTQTFALAPNSNAVDILPLATLLDQRGISRPQGSASDIGAYEASQALSVSISENQVNEQAGRAVLTVSRVSASPFTTSVSISNSDPSIASLAMPNIEIAANQTSATIIIESINNDLVDGLRTVTFTATAVNFIDGTATLDIADDDLDGDGDSIIDSLDNCPAVANLDQANLDLDADGDACDSSNDAALSLNFDANIITEGGGVSAVVSRNSSTNQALSVALSISGSNTMQIPQTVTIAAGQSESDSFSIQSIDDTLTNGDRALILTAVAANHANAINLILIQDNDSNDTDGDTILNSVDNCPLTANTNQANFDGDSQGDVCDNDDDNDGLPDDYENANGLNSTDPSDANTDADNDGFSNTDEFNAGSNPQVADTDDNNNGIPDSAEGVPVITPILQLLLLDD